MNPRLLVAITAHGYGHAAQTSAVIAALRQLQPGLQLLLLTDLPRSYLSTRFEEPFEHHPYRCDPGLLMHSALSVDVPGSRAAYRDYHRNWDLYVGEQRQLLRQWQPDLVLANVPYAILEAARAEAVPAVAMCSLNWADLYQHYCSGDAGNDAIHRQIRAAYASCGAFLRLTPGMPMDELANRIVIGPVARTGRDRRIELRSRLKIRGHQQLVLAALGGFDTPATVRPDAGANGLFWIAPANWNLGSTPHANLEATDMPFIDLVASADVVLTKPGYGSYTEAACHGKTVCHLQRPGWPEAPYLNTWLHSHARAQEIPASNAQIGNLEPIVANLQQAPHHPPPQPTGAGQAARYLSQLL